MPRHIGLLHPFALALVLYSFGCSKPVAHDEALAGKRALEFSEAAFVKRDFDAAYKLLSDRAKAYVSVNAMRSAVASAHLNGYPNNVQVTQSEPMPAESKAIYIFLAGENPSELFAYRLTMEKTAASDYRVAVFDRESSLSHRR